MPGHVWERLAGLLEEHTRAKEEICYLPVLRRLPHATECRQEAIADHEDIREAISEAALQRVGSVPWWRAVRAVVASSIDHIDREETDVLAEFPLTVTITRRRELGRQWRAFIAAWRLDTAPRASGQSPQPREASLPARSVPFRAIGSEGQKHGNAK